MTLPTQLPNETPEEIAYGRKVFHKFCYDVALIQWGEAIGAPSRVVGLQQWTLEVTCDGGYFESTEDGIKEYDDDR